MKSMRQKQNSILQLVKLIKLLVKVLFTVIMVIAKNLVFIKNSILCQLNKILPNILFGSFLFYPLIILYINNSNAIDLSIRLLFIFASFSFISFIIFSNRSTEKRLSLCEASLITYGCALICFCNSDSLNQLLCIYLTSKLILTL